MASDRVRELLAATHLFGLLDEAAMESVRHELQPVRLPGGGTLFGEGDPSDSLYILVRGRLQALVVRDAGREEAIGEIVPGQLVGEMGVITGEPRSATIRAMRDSDLVRFSSEAFRRVVERNPAVMMLIVRGLVQRLRRMAHDKVRKTLTTIALLPLVPEVDTGRVAQRLAEAVGTIGPTVLVNRGTVDEALGPGSAVSAEESKISQVMTFLDRLESEFQYVIYQADAGPSAWTALCARQADRILVAADSTIRQTRSPNGLPAMPALQIPSSARRDLLLLHSGGAPPSGTAAWLTGLPDVMQHHHVRIDSTADFGRLARILTGKAVGLVLGGGGARGFAHIGVIRAFNEARIPIDLIGGTSMGAVIAAQYALGNDADALMTLNRRGWIEADPLKDKTLPLTALLASRKLDRMLASMYGDARIEDLWLRYFCVAANLTQASVRVHRQGPLLGAVRSSLAIPGIALPVCEDGDLYVDGGVLNNLPGDVMKEMSDGIVVGVDVSPQKDLSIDPGYQRVPSSWRILWSRLNPFSSAIRIPGILSIMARSAMLASVHNSSRVAEGVDLYLRPPVDGVGIFEWKALERLAEIGYAFTRRRLESWNPNANP